MSVPNLCECSACANCEIEGWRCGGDVHDVEFRCRIGAALEKGRKCLAYEPGDPWEEVKGKEMEWRKSTGASTSR